MEVKKMIILCKFKEDFEQKMSSKYSNILKDPRIDLYASYWAVFDDLETGNFNVVWIEDSYGDCWLTCTKEQFKDLFDFEPSKELA
jgi:hypothetical protein